MVRDGFPNPRLSLHSLWHQISEKEEDNSLCWWTPLSPVSGRRRLKVKLVAVCVPAAGGCCAGVYRYTGTTLVHRYTGKQTGTPTSARCHTLTTTTTTSRPLRFPGQDPGEGDEVQKRTHRLAQSQCHLGFSWGQFQEFGT